MKFKIIVLFIIIISVSCHQTEVINIDYGEYHTFAEVDRGPVTIDKNKKGLSGAFWDAIKKIKAENLIEKPLSGKEKYEYKIYINEKGELDKIVIINGMGSKADQIIVDNLKSLKFEPAIKNNKPVKFAESFEYDGSDYWPFVEKMPEPIGGIKAIAELVKYPEAAKKAGVEGRVFVQAFVNEAGEVDSVKLLKGIGFGCDEAAIDAVKKTKFKPAVDNGDNVKTHVVVPILFKLK